MGFFKKIIFFIIVILFNVVSLTYSNSLSEVNTNNLLLMIANSKGKVVLVSFWASWCPYCIKEMKELVEIRKRYSTDDLKILGVSLDSSKSSYTRILEESKINYPTYLASDSRIGMMFNVFGIPSIIIYDKNGRLVKQISGYVDANQLERYINKLVKNKK